MDERHAGTGDGAGQRPSQPEPTIESLLQRPSQWLDATGPHADIVVSTRIRLARNLRGVPFSQRAREEQLLAVMGSVERAATAVESFQGAHFFSLGELSEVETALLVERHLVSRELKEAARPRGLLVAPGERVSVMVNEEDHLRLQSMVSGLQPGEAWSLADTADDDLDSVLEYAYHEEWGFLTACPTNAGTGLRASVQVHLPALVLTKQIDKVLKGIMQMGLAVRGFYGEGSEVMGNLFQISNQTTLGLTERETLESLERVTRQILGAEERARETLLRDARIQIEDKVYRAYGSLLYGRAMSNEEVVNLCSAVRLGVSLGFVDLPPLGVLNELLVTAHPAHLERRLSRSLDPVESNVRRAEFVRRTLAAAGHGSAPTS